MVMAVDEKLRVAEVRRVRATENMKGWTEQEAGQPFGPTSFSPEEARDVLGLVPASVAASPNRGRVSRLLSGYLPETIHLSSDCGGCSPEPEARVETGGERSAPELAMRHVGQKHADHHRINSM